MKIATKTTGDKNMNKCDKQRTKELNNKDFKNGPIFYLMSRDQRVNDNWALIFTKELADERKQQMAVVFFFSPTFSKLTARQYNFMIEGLKKIEKNLFKLNIPFFIITGDSLKEAISFFTQKKAGAVVVDFDPLKENCLWREKIAKAVNCKMIEIDTHNIVPYSLASKKQEFAAYTIRPKINKHLDNFLLPIPKLKRQERKWQGKIKSINWKEVHNKTHIDKSVAAIKWLVAGEDEAKKKLKEFIINNLNSYNRNKNNPNKEVLSNLSPYIHFGQISTQRIALSIKKSNSDGDSKKSFLEELIVRKELADNFCFYNKKYDSFEGFPLWAKNSLNKHKKDKRLFLYNRRKLENAETHDDLWNACQLEMMLTGKMHGYLRMYWAKKILEWTTSPKEALSTAIYLNDKYELDGKDPKGYNGVAWSIGGVHDRAWGERPIFGKIRYMSYNGSKSKFNVKNYIIKIKNLL